jgi:hypothetical protein
MKQFKVEVFFEFPDSFELPEIVKKDMANVDAGKTRCKDYAMLTQFLKTCIADYYGTMKNDVVSETFEDKEKECKDWWFYNAIPINLNEED